MATAYRCEIVPLASHQLSFRIDQREVLRWNTGTDYPRPYFFPVIAPSGEFLTRMGHPGAPDHDHHQSLWFAHNKVLGINFWGNSSNAHIRQLAWLAYDDGDEQCRMAVELGWFDGHDPSPLLKQELICELKPLADSQFTLELQSRFVPTSESLEFAQTNFGFLAVRVAKSVSAAFGSGVLTGSTGQTTEKALFGQPASWMDYSGPTDKHQQRTEGLTCIDHPSNPGQPTGWHVRDDGWFCASPCMSQSQNTTRTSPLMLRYMLHIHAGAVNPDIANALLTSFASTKPLEVIRSAKPHVRSEISRMA
jgi:hypothetical protein